MKNIVLFMLMFVSFQNKMSAQLATFGVKIGGNYANFTSPQLQTKALTSYHTGVLVELKLGKSFSIQPELLYSTQGASYDNVIEEVKAELGYISIPIMARIKLGETVSLDLGPQFSFLAFKKVDFKTDVKDLDFGAGGGLTVNITKSIFLQGRYIAGLTEIGKNAEIKNAVGQLSVGVTF